jgi:Ni,Fe-hydrogenase III large subunit
MSLPSLAFGNLTLEASLLTAGGPSSARDASLIRESILGVIQAMSGERYVNLVNAVGGGRRMRRDSNMDGRSMVRWPGC